MNIYRIKIGDLVVVRDREEAYGVGLVMNTITNGFNGQKDVRVKLKDRDLWFPSFYLRKVTCESR